MTDELTALRSRVNILAAKRRDALRRVKEGKAAVEAALTALADAEDGRRLLQAVAEEVQRSAHGQMTGVVSRCLEGVFGADAYEFDIDIQRKRGRTDAVLQFERDGLTLDDPLDESGGGCIDVAALAGRIASLRLHRPALRGALFLDEPFKFPSPHFQPLVPELLMTLAEKLKLQIVFTTNNPAYQCGKVIDLEK